MVLKSMIYTPAGEVVCDSGGGHYRVEHTWDGTVANALSDYAVCGNGACGVYKMVVDI